MRGKFRVVWYLSVACSLLLYASLGAPLLASDSSDGPSFSGSAELDGPVHLRIDVTPPIGRPRDKIRVEVTLTNQLNDGVAPTVELMLPQVFSSSLARYPAATTFDYQSNRVSWQPVLSENGDSERLELEYTVSVADMVHPEQEIEVRLSYDETVSDTSVNFWIGSAPTAAVQIDRQTVAVGQPVKLQALAAGPGPFTQTWFLSDGRQIVANDPEVSFGLPGIYEVRLQVANPLAVATAISAITVVSQPTAEFAVDDDLPVVGQAVQFTNASGGERPLQSYWYFGDGAESSEANPNHVYTAPGTYTVRLVVSSDFGQSEISTPLTIGANPVADMVLPETARTGEPFELMGFGDDSVNSLRWDLGDGRIGEGSTISHVYHRAGIFTVSLIANNEFGETVVQRQIQVDGGRYTLYLPFANGAQETVPSQDVVVTETASPPAEELFVPETGDGGGAEGEQVLLEQSGSTALNPGGAAAAPAPDSSPLVALPPQTPLAEGASGPEQLLWYVNEARRLHGLGPVEYNYELSIAAQHHTVDMAGNPELMHIGSDGSRPAERQQRFGYLGAYGGEAVAWGWESPVPVVEYWVNSPPHRALILNPAADQIGVGFTADGYAPNIWYWAVEFGIIP